jgi:hypothetical protein
MMREDDLPPEIIEIPIRRGHPTQPLDMGQQRNDNRFRPQLRRVHYPIALDRFASNVPVERTLVQSRAQEQLKHKRPRLWWWLVWLIGRTR